MKQFCDLPEELVEIILNKLEGRFLLSACQVSRSWLRVSSRIAKRRCKCVPNDIIAENIIGGEGDEFRWIILGRNIEVDNIFEDSYFASDACWEVNHHFMKTWGPWVVTMERNRRNIRLYNMDNMKDHTVICVPDDRIEMIETTVQFIIVRTLSSILFFRPNYFNHKNVRKLVVQIQDKTMLSDVQQMSVSDKYIVLSKAGGVLNIFSLRLSGGMIALKLLSSIESAAVIFLSVWQDTLTYTTYAGKIETYDLITLSHKTTSRHNEIQYANPTWSLKGVIFSSTSNLRLLMSYWHLVSGFPQNIFGRPNEPLLECKLWKCEDEDVISATTLGKFIAIGTSAGQVYLYSLSDSFFSADNQSLCDELSRVPNFFYSCFILPKFISLRYLQDGIRVIFSDNEAICWVDYLVLPSKESYRDVRCTVALIQGYSDLRKMHLE